MRIKFKIQIINELEEISESDLEEYCLRLIEGKYQHTVLPQGLGVMSPFSHLSFLFQYNQFIMHLINDLLNKMYSEKNHKRFNFYIEVIRKNNKLIEEKLNETDDFKRKNIQTLWWNQYLKDTDEVLKNYPEITSASMAKVNYLIALDKKEERGYSDEYIEKLKLEAEEIEKINMETDSYE